MLRTLRLTLAGSVLGLGAAHAQVVNIWPGVAPGSERWTQKELTVTDTPLGTVIFNVVTPTLTAYLPEPAKATGTGVIVAPGGAFVALAMDVEARGVARWLQQRGIAAFVLKYRTIEKRGDGIPAMDQDTAGRDGIADGIQALKVVRPRAAGRGVSPAPSGLGGGLRALEGVRQRGAEWGVPPGRIGIVGFSAGAMVASGTVLQADSAARPSFAAMIYGGPVRGTR